MSNDSMFDAIGEGYYDGDLDSLFLPDIDPEDVHRDNSYVEFFDGLRDTGHDRDDEHDAAEGAYSDPYAGYDDAALSGYTFDIEPE